MLAVLQNPSLAIVAGISLERIQGDEWRQALRVARSMVHGH